MNVEIVGHVGYVLIVIGLILIGRKRAKFGWLLHSLGCGLWAANGFALEITAMWTWSLVFMTVGWYHACTCKENEDEQL